MISYTQPYGTCPQCGSPLIYSPKRQLLVCSEPLCKYCQVFSRSDVDTTDTLLEEVFLRNNKFDNPEPSAEQNVKEFFKNKN